MQGMTSSPDPAEQRAASATMSALIRGGRTSGRPVLTGRALLDHMDSELRQAEAAGDEQRVAAVNAEIDRLFDQARAATTQTPPASTSPLAQPAGLRRPARTEALTERLRGVRPA